MLAPVRTVAPTEFAISLEEARAHLRGDDNDDDPVIDALIAAATAHLDGYSGILGRALVTQTWRQDYDKFCDRLALPLYPVASISSVKYYDASDVEQTLSSGVYRLLTDSLGPYVARIPNQSWPAIGDRDAPLSVTFVAGTAAADVPAGIKTAIAMLVAHWFEHREAVAGSTMGPLPLGVDRLLAPYRRVGL